MLDAYGARSGLHSLQIFLSVETEDTERSGFPRACSTNGKTLLSITGWSANHSAKAPGGRRTAKSEYGGGRGRAGTNTVAILSSRLGASTHLL